ncbi:MAG: hypothetical protein AB8G18_16095 [Gammaproteobacteria bacterium]
MAWTPISRTDIVRLIDSACERMSVEQQRVWKSVRIAPEKWNQNPWGKKGNGFWVVGLIGNTVIWFNDIEEGFNRSTYIAYGQINEYLCNQDDLEWTVQNIINEIQGQTD